MGKILQIGLDGEDYTASQKRAVAADERAGGDRLIHFAEGHWLPAQPPEGRYDICQQSLGDPVTAEGVNRDYFDAPKLGQETCRILQSRG